MQESQRQLELLHIEWRLWYVNSNYSGFNSNNNNSSNNIGSISDLERMQHAEATGCDFYLAYNVSSKGLPALPSTSTSTSLPFPAACAITLYVFIPSLSYAFLPLQTFLLLTLLSMMCCATYQVLRIMLKLLLLLLAAGSYMACSVYLYTRSREMSADLA